MAVGLKKRVRGGSSLTKWGLGKVEMFQRGFLVGNRQRRVPCVWNGSAQCRGGWEEGGGVHVCSTT